MNGRFLFLGAAHVDRIARADAPYRAAASNPGRTTESLGGAAFNAALALRAFGAEVDLITARGGDAAADAVGRAVQAAGIGDQAITWLDRRTPSYTAVLDPAGELVVAVADMALYDLLSPRVLRRRHVRTLVEEAAAVLVDANLPEQTLASLALPARTPLFALAVSPAKAIRLRPLLPRLTALFLSREEAAAIADLPADAPHQNLAAWLRSAGVRRAAITDGPAAVAVLDDDAVYLQVPPPAEPVLGVIGAGDTLAGTAALAFIEGLSFVGSVRLGIAAAARKIAVGLGSGRRADCEMVAATLPPLESLPEPGR